MTAPKENGVILEAHGTPKSLSNAKRKRKVGKKQTKLDFKNFRQNMLIKSKIEANCRFIPKYLIPARCKQRTHYL